MNKSKRSIRRHHISRLKTRMRNYWRDHNLGWWTSGYRENPTSRWIEQMVETHGKPCSKLCCGNQRAICGPPISEQRHLIDNMNKIDKE